MRACTLLNQEQVILLGHDTNILIFVDKVSAGDLIGTVQPSYCSDTNHIHVALTKDGGVLDPSPYIYQRPIKLPKWNQICDDYRIVKMVRRMNFIEKTHWLNESYIHIESPVTVPLILAYFSTLFRFVHEPKNMHIAFFYLCFLHNNQKIS